MKSESGPYVEVKIKKEIHERLLHCAEVTGRSYQSLLDEAVMYFEEAYVPAYIWDAKRQSASA